VHGTNGPMENTPVIDIMPPAVIWWWWWWWFPCMSRRAQRKTISHTDPICFRCFESDFRWYFQWTFL